MSIGQVLRNALLWTLLTCSVASAQPQGGNEDVYFRNRADASKYALIVTGPGASEEIGIRFWQWSVALHDTLAGDYGYSSDSIVLLNDDGTALGNRSTRIDGSSRREDIERAIADLRQRLEPGDQLTVFLIGHGSSLTEDAKFNIVGPDITGVEFSQLLDGFQEQDVVVINTTSASYEFSEDLSSRGRVIVSATRSRAERYDPVFAAYLLEALTNRAGDRDKNGRVSVLEAFTYASQSSLAWYRDQGRLPTERAVLDDNGDQTFAMEPGPGAGDGRLAEIAYFDWPNMVELKSSPQAQQIYAQMQDLERTIFLLRADKQNYLESDYWARMEELLIELAMKTEQYNDLP
ncbi:MAG: hypothetical protein R3332_05215 [Pseudohongiellaceae bacterium]|nr:hypothetical protein [Pseudohongiellaceae bacterium]